MVLFQREAAHSLFFKGMAHFDTHQVGCVEGRAIRRRGGEGTRAYAITLHTTQLHTTNQGDNSLRHPSNGVCGRESCQACGGEGTHANTTTQHFISDIHYTQHSRSQALRDPLTSTPIMWGVEGRVGRRVGGPQAKITRQHLLVPPFFYYTQTA